LLVADLKAKFDLKARVQAATLVAGGRGSLAALARSGARRDASGEWRVRGDARAETRIARFG
jgi:hypothetical protein